MIYVVTYDTESGDRGVVGYFNRRPTNRHLTALFRELMPDEFVSDVDGVRRMVFWSVEGLKEMKLPKPVDEVQTI